MMHSDALGLANELSDFISRTLEVISSHETKPIKLVLIINSHAGGFSNHKQCQEHLRELRAGQASIAQKPKILECELLIPQSATEARELALLACNEASLSGKRLVLASAGGDGTHNACLSGLMMASDLARTFCIVLRIPLGTGNDAGDSPDFACFVKNTVVACNENRSLPLSFVDAVEIDLGQGGSSYAFNILSFGLDAYVVHLTNTLKAIIPGSFYKLFADLAVLFYLGSMKKSVLKLELNAESNDIFEKEEIFGIVVIGASGKRMYGHGLHVLPDERNICAIVRGSLFENIALKAKLYKGTHVSLPACISITSRKLCISPDADTWVQFDGEVVQLKVGTSKKSYCAQVITTELRYPVYPKKD